MSRYQPYSNYKESEVEWLGKVPEHWQVKRLGQYFDDRREKVSDKEFQPLSVTKKGIVPQLETAAKTDDGDNRKKVCAGDYVINSRSDRKGSSGLSALTGSVSLINTVLTPKNIEPLFIHHLFRSYPFQEEFYRYGKGIVADLWSTNYSEMKNINIPIPEYGEQNAIANFLDRETVKIDTLIAKQERMIELLGEKRSALISHAVTKGLDPNVKMKDSGVAWLGEVPEHWKVTLLKRVASIQGGYAFSTNDFTDEGVQLVKISNLYQNKFSLDRQPTFVSKEVALKNTDFILQKGDLILSLTGTLGKRDYGYTVVIDQDGEFLLNQRVAKIIPFHSLISTMFVDYLMKSEQYLSQIYSLPFGTKQANLSNDNVMGASCVLPSLQEQNAIVNYLDTQTAKIDTLIAKAGQAIELMKERRTALISAAVTGKIDVRKSNEI